MKTQIKGDCFMGKERKIQERRGKESEEKGEKERN